MCECAIDFFRGAVIPDSDPSDPLAVCVDCGAMICNQHGQRDPVYGQFLCVLCDVHALDTAAGESDDESNDSDDGGGLGHRGRAPLVRTLSEFLARRPQYRAVWADEFEADVADLKGGDGPVAAFFPHDERRRELLAAAVVLAVRLDMPAEHLPPRVSGIVGGVVGGGAWVGA